MLTIMIFQRLKKHYTEKQLWNLGHDLRALKNNFEEAAKKTLPGPFQEELLACIKAIGEFEATRTKLEGNRFSRSSPVNDRKLCELAQSWNSVLPIMHSTPRS